MEKLLYVVRPLENCLVTYENIENDLYKDKTCLDHDNCIVRINKDENGDYRIVELVNGEAKEHRIYHVYETPLFETKYEAIKAFPDTKIEVLNKAIANTRSIIAEYEAKIEKIENSGLEIKECKIEDFDFDDMVYLAKENGWGSEVFSFKVDKKLFDRNGVIEIHSNDYSRECDSDGGLIIEGYCVDKNLKFVNEDGIYYRAFKDRSSAENFMKKREIEDNRSNINYYETLVRKYERDIEKYNKIKTEAKIYD